MPLNCPSSVVEGLNGEIGVVASVVRMMVQIDVVDGHWTRECERQCCATAHVDSSNGSPRQITIKRTLTSRSGTAPRTIRHGEVTRAFWALTIPRQKHRRRHFQRWLWRLCRVRRADKVFHL